MSKRKQDPPSLHKDIDSIENREQKKQLENEPQNEPQSKIVIPQNTVKLQEENIKKNQFESSKKYFTISIYAIFVVAVSTLIIYLIMNGKETKAGITKILSTMAPFIAAFFIAFLLHPIVKRFDHLFKKLFHEKRPRLRKGCAIFVSYLLVMIILIIGGIYIGPQLNKSVVDLSSILSSKVPDILAVSYDYLNNLQSHFPDLDLQFMEEQIKSVIPHISEIASFGSNLLNSIIPWLFNISVSIVKLIINTLLSIVISCYMLSDQRSLLKHMKRFIYAILKEERATQFIQTSKECSSIFSKYILGKALDSVIIGILCFILMLILQLDYPLVLSVIVGITNMIPYFGPFIGAIPGILIYLFISPIQAIIFAFMILVLQQFDGLYLGPKILGESTGIKPLWVIFGITIGGSYFGPLGMFLGVPVVAVISYLLNSFVKRRLTQKNITDF